MRLSTRPVTSRPRTAGRTRALYGDPFILPQGFAPGRRRLATRIGRTVRLTGPGLVDELREGLAVRGRRGRGLVGAHEHDF